MAKKRTLKTVAETLPRLERRLAYKEKDRQDVKKKIEALYKDSIRGECQVKPGREDLFEDMNTEDHVCEEGHVLEAKDSRLSREISALTDLIEEAKEEIFSLAEAEIEGIPEQISKLSPSLIKNSESILSELVEALVHVSSCHWRLNGTFARLPFVGNMLLPPLPREMVIEANKRLDVVFKSQPKQGDAYAVELQRRELRKTKDKGAKELALSTIANAR